MNKLVFFCAELQCKERTLIAVKIWFWDNVMVGIFCPVMFTGKLHHRGWDPRLWLLRMCPVVWAAVCGSCSWVLECILMQQCNWFLCWRKPYLEKMSATNVLKRSQCAGRDGSIYAVWFTKNPWKDWYKSIRAITSKVIACPQPLTAFSLPGR